MHENIYRQNASAEVDAAWVALGVDCMLSNDPSERRSDRTALTSDVFDTPDRAAVVPPDQAEQSGLASHHVQLSERYGGGYPANVEGLHHLHCLVILPMKYFQPLAPLL